MQILTNHLLTKDDDMIPLTTRQRDILHLLLKADAPIGASDLGEDVGLTARQVRYNLRTVKSWLAEHDAKLDKVSGVGMQIACEDTQKQDLLSELTSLSDFQLVLTAGERQQLIALQLLTADKPLVIGQLQNNVQVSRTTILKDLGEFEAWAQVFRLTLQRRPNYGIWLEGSELDQRQALAALLWGDISFEDPVMSITHNQGLQFALADDVKLIPVTQQINELVQAWDIRKALEHVAYAEVELGGRFTDEAALHLALAFAIQTQRAGAGQFAECDPDTLDWLRERLVWSVSADIWNQLHPEPTRAAESETAAVAMHLLAGSRNDMWPGDLDTNGAFTTLIDALMDTVAKVYREPDLKSDRSLRHGLVSHVIPACMRQRFGLWAPPTNYTENLSDNRYGFERIIARELATQITEHTGVELPQVEIRNLILLMRAAYIRKRPTRPRRVMVVCPSGMATTQLLLARLKARFPRLGTYEVMSLRKLDETQIKPTDLIITTVPLSLVNVDTDNIIQIHPLLSPADVEAITQWIA